MKAHIIPVVLFASAISAQACAPGSAQEIKGNWYCQAVKAISYANFGTPGSYNKVTSFNADGKCSSADQAYSGSIAPLDEEVSWHFRGPLSLKQFAYYTPGTATPPKRRDLKSSPHERRHGANHKHAHLLERDDENLEGRAPCEMVTATIGGKVASWMNEYMCDPNGIAPTPVAAADDGRYAAAAAITSVAEAAAAIPSAFVGMNAGAGNWGRQAYYSAENGSAEGLVFLNHMGGQGSGVFDNTWGNSLSYASADASTGAAGPETLTDAMLDDGVEVVVMSDNICAGDCGTVRPGTVAYHGFSGPDKVFLMEFSMPFTGKNGFNADMPAIWTLNGQIPNTLQYGEASCSCWESGCGEWDIMEILDSGNTRAKSTFHGNPSGGDSNYFERPTGETMKIAVIFEGERSAGHIVVLPDEVSFDRSMADAVVAGWLNQMADPALRVMFDLVQ